MDGLKLRHSTSPVMTDPTRSSECQRLADDGMDDAAVRLTAEQIADFIQRHRGELSRFIIRKLGSDEHAADILQDAYLRLARRQTPDIVDNPRAFVFRIVANLIIDFQRLSHNRLPHEDDEEIWHSLPENRPGPENRYQQQQRLDVIGQALAELPETCRQAFYLNRVEGYSHGDIAKRLNISESMVAKHLARAMQHCRDRLKNH